MARPYQTPNVARWKRLSFPIDQTIDADDDNDGSIQSSEGSETLFADRLDVVKHLFDRDWVKQWLDECLNENFSEC